MKVAIYLRKNRPSGTRPTIEEQEKILKQKAKLLGWTDEEIKSESLNIFMGIKEYNNHNNFMLNLRRRK
jgi:hypothetical protein